MRHHFFKLFTLSFLLVGCVVNAPTVRETQIIHLSKLLHTLAKDVKEREAMALSKDIFFKTQALTKEFSLISPPFLHNFLVNIGLRKKGLCYHWSDALYVHLNGRYPSFEFHFMGANIGEYWFEHNVLVIVAKDGNVEEGIIIDPWRGSGNLYFSKARDDEKYIWIHRPLQGCMH